jgi:hypothetical protein
MTLGVPALGIALLLLLPQSWEPGSRPKEQGRWLCWMYSGKGARAIAASQAHPVDWFAHHIFEFDYELAVRLPVEPELRELGAEIRDAGTFAGREVREIEFRKPGSRDPMAKMIPLGAGDEFRPVVFIVADTAVTFSPPRVARVAGTEILVSRHGIAGTGNFYYEDYFVWDEALQIAVNLAVDAAIIDETRRLLPSGREIRRGGGFDVDRLRYAAPVWQEGDPNCCPTAGRVEIQFELIGPALHVVTSRYDPDSR